MNVKKQLQLYTSPKIVELEFHGGANLLSSMSIFGDIFDYEEGEIYEGIYTDSTNF